MGNREYFLLCKVEDILIAKNYEFQIYFLNFCREIIQKNKLNFDNWLKFRLKCIKEKNFIF